MKLIEILRYISFDTDIQILSYDLGAEKEEVLYKGAIFNIPWALADLELDNSNGENAIYTNTETGELLIYVIE